MASDFRFDKYVCDGDESTIEREGYRITARIVRDEDTHPDEFDCYPDGAVDAWKNDEWWFVGVVLAVSYHGIELDDFAASLWGVECNYPGTDNSYLAEVADELLPEALERALRRRSIMATALTC